MDNDALESRDLEGSCDIFKWRAPEVLWTGFFARFKSMLCYCV